MIAPTAAASGKVVADDHAPGGVPARGVPRAEAPTDDSDPVATCVVDRAKPPRWLAAMTAADRAVGRHTCRGRDVDELSCRACG